MNPNLLLADVETTNLDSKTGMLLEVGFLLTDSTLKSKGTMSWLWPSACGPVVQELYARADDYVKKMHTDNGLWQELYEAGIPGGKCHGMTDVQAVEQMVKLLAQIGFTSSSRGMLIGRNPSFDLRWLAQFAPPVCDCFNPGIGAADYSYGTFDIASVQRAVQLKYGDEARWPHKQPHRVVGDCENELAELNYYMQNFKDVAF